jgi:hypothetical protein
MGGRHRLGAWFRSGAAPADPRAPVSHFHQIAMRHARCRPLQSLELLLHPVVREGAAVEVIDFEIAGRAKQSESFRLSIAGVEPDTPIAEPASMRFELLQQPPPDPATAHRGVDEDTPDLARLVVDRFDSPQPTGRPSR